MTAVGSQLECLTQPQPSESGPRCSWQPLLPKETSEVPARRTECLMTNLSIPLVASMPPRFDAASLRCRLASMPPRIARNRFAICGNMHRLAPVMQRNSLRTHFSAVEIAVQASVPPLPSLAGRSAPPQFRTHVCGRPAAPFPAQYRYGFLIAAPDGDS